MRKRVKRVISLVLAALMVVTGIQFAPLQAKAAETVKSYDFSELNEHSKWGVASSEIDDDGVLSIAYEEQYKSIVFEVPADVDFTKVTGVSFAVADGTDPGKFAYKLHTAEDTDWAGTPCQYGNPNISLSMAADIVYISIMSNDTEVLEGSFTGVTFTEDDEAFNEELTDVTYNFADLVKVDTVNSPEALVSEGGEATFSFERQYQEAVFELPADIDVADIRAINYVLSSDNEGSLSFKNLGSGLEQLDVIYSGVSITPSEGMTHIGIMNLAEGASTAKVMGVTLTIAGTPAPEINKTYTLPDLETGKKGSVTSIENPDTHAVTLEFAGQYQEIFYAVPKEIDFSKVHRVTVEMEDGKAAGLAVKFYTEGDYTSGDWPAAKNENCFYGSADCEINDENIKYFGIMSMQDVADFTAEVSSITFHTTGWGYGSAGVVTYGENLITNPNFADADVSAWNSKAGDATITSETGDTPVFDDVVTYGKITDRTASGDCFAQDVTAKMSSGKKYEYSFWMKLDADDYADAAEEKREICLSPYITADSKTSYLGSYSTGQLDNNCIKRVNAGEWTKFEGTFSPRYTGTASEIVLRFLEQGTNYGDGECVKGTYYLTGVSFREKIEPKKYIQQDIPDLKSIVSSDEFGIGDDAYTGVSLMQSEMTDETLMELVEKHFNAVTFGNELKMDAIMDYQNDAHGPMTTATFTRKNGNTVTDMAVPELDFSRAEAMLDVIKAWNDSNPDDIIKVRGHVLVWHSQAPEWFFHEGFDASKPYVSASEMDIRQEWYIKSVLDHFFNEESPYKEMFYGWDVVNEACSDSSGTYRSGNENSSWWRVYGNEDFIVNAFRYANAYAPEDLELYYNDYNECVSSKIGAIANLLTEVKNHENDEIPTRISGFGMQGHHGCGSPTKAQIINAATTYGNIVGKVQVTELDVKASNDFDGTKATLSNEYTKQAYYYKDVFDAYREVDKIDGIDANCITVWGVIDGNSWLLDNQSGIGGGSDGTHPVVPLLFDDDYQAKPAYWGFVDSSKLEPFVNSVTVNQAVDPDDAFKYANSYAINGCDASFTPVWDEDGLQIKVKVVDATIDENDSVTLYLDMNNGSGEYVVKKISLKRSDGYSDNDGYEADFAIPAEIGVMSQFLFDIVVQNGDSDKVAYNDLKMSQETTSKYFAKATAKPFMQIKKGNIGVDGQIEAAWNNTQWIPLTIKGSSPEATAQSKLLWDEDYLYVLTEVIDSNLDTSSSADHEKDSVEVFIDENNHKSDSYEADDKQYRVNVLNETTFNNCIENNILHSVTVIEGGYLVEAAYKWTEITPEIGAQIGLELQINDGKGGSRIGTVSWFDESGSGWSTTRVFGVAELVEGAEPEKMYIQPLMNYTYTGSAIKPYVVVRQEGKKLVEGVDYTVAYKNNVNASEKIADGTIENFDAKKPTVIVTGKGSYSGTVKANFTILRKDLNNKAISAEYTKSIKSSTKALKPAVTLKFNGKKLTTNDMTVSYLADTEEAVITDSIAAGAYGRYYIIVAGKGNYSGTIKLPLEIIDKDLVLADTLKVSLPKTKAYTGSDITLTTKELVVKNGSKTLPVTSSESTDDGYYVTYENNKYVGTASVKITGTGKVIGTITKEFKITGVSVKKLSVKGISDKDYTGEEITFDALKVFDGKNELVLQDNANSKTDGCFVEYENNLAVGTASVKIIGTGKYEGTLVKTFKIRGVAIKTLKITGISDQDYTGSAITFTNLAVTEGKAKTPVAILVNDNADNGLNGCYVTYKNNLAVGTASVTITGSGKYTGTVTKTFKIKGVALKNLKVTVPTTVEYTGADITFDTTQIKVSERIDKKYVDLPVKNAASTENGYSVKYENNKEIGTAKVTITGTGKYTGSIVKTFKINGIKFAKAEIKLADTDKICVYTGSEHSVDLNGKITYKVLDSQKAYFEANEYTIGEDNVVALKSSDYDIRLTKGGTNVGKATYTVTGMGYFTGSKKFDITITKQDLNSASIGMVQLPSQDYVKGGVKPQILLLLKADNKYLTLNKDFTVSYSDNDKVGTATATVKGKGNFTGSLSQKFEIQQADLSYYTAVASDVLVSQGYKATNLVITDDNGKKLIAGKDYDEELEYLVMEEYPTLIVDENEEELKNRMVAGTEMLVKAKAKTGSNYIGFIMARYYFVTADISKATVKINDQTFTGEKIDLGSDDVTVTMKINGKTETLVYNKDYTIKIGDCSKAGKVNVVITGVPTVSNSDDTLTYTGTKKATFKLGVMSWNFTKAIKEFFN